MGWRLLRPTNTVLDWGADLHRIRRGLRLIALALFRLHRMHKMQTIVTDDSPYLFVSLSRGSTHLRCTKMAERIQMLFGVNTSGGHETLC